MLVIKNDVDERKSATYCMAIDHCGNWMQGYGTNVEEFGKLSK